jgi:YggT family protein
MGLEYIRDVVQLLFYSYTILLFVRIVLSWFPSWRFYTWVRFISFCTDPYLNLFRRILPPLGGVMDLSPILAFFALRLAEMLVLRLLF